MEKIWDRITRNFHWNRLDYLLEDICNLILIIFLYTCFIGFHIGLFGGGVYLLTLNIEERYLGIIPIILTIVFMCLDYKIYRELK